MVEEKQEEKFQLEVVNDIPEGLVEQLKPGDMLLKARSLHESFLPEPWLSELATDSLNARLIWRHRDPDDPRYNGVVYGRNLHNEVKDGFIDTYYRVFGGPEGSRENTMQTLIKTKLELGEPIGISKGFLKQKQNGEIKRVVSLEDSITYKPQCNKCTTTEVIQMEEEKEMKELVEKLQEELNDTKMQLEANEKSLVEKTEDLSKLETEKEAYEAKLNEAKDEKVSLEDKFIELSDAFKKFKLESVTAMKTPLIDEILKYEDESMKEPLRAVYNGWEVKKLEERLEENKGKQAQTTVIVKSMDEERKDVMKKLEEKDIGMSALKGMRKPDMDIANEVEAEMRAEGLLS